jgi:hypothetical protein
MTTMGGGEGRREEVAEMLAEAESIVVNLKAGGASRGDFAAALVSELESGNSAATAEPATGED